MGKASRAKGRAGQSMAIDLLNARDYVCADVTGGIASFDIMAVKDGITWAVEVKNAVSINVREFIKQAREQAARKKGMRWMVLARIDGYSGAWLVLRQGEKPIVWGNVSMEIEAA